MEVYHLIAVHVTRDIPHKSHDFSACHVCMITICEIIAFRFILLLNQCSRITYTAERIAVSLSTLTWRIKIPEMPAIFARANTSFSNG
jgi:hypothetical protein